MRMFLLRTCFLLFCGFSSLKLMFSKSIELVDKNSVMSKPFRVSHTCVINLFRTLKYTISKQWTTIKRRFYCFLSQQKWNNEDIITTRLNLCCKVVLERTIINKKNNSIQAECWQTHSTNEIPSVDSETLSTKELARSYKEESSIMHVFMSGF